MAQESSRPPRPARPLALLLIVFCVLLFLVRSCRLDQPQTPAAAVATTRLPATAPARSLPTPSPTATATPEQAAHAPALALTPTGAAATPVSAPPPPVTATLYADELGPEWANWSWDTEIEPSQAGEVYSGTGAIRLRYDQAWAGFYLHARQPVPLAPYDRLRFWVHGGEKTREVRVLLAEGQAIQQDAGTTVTVPGGEWTQVEISLADLQAPPLLGGIVWQENEGAAQPPWFLDEVTLVGQVLPGPALRVDAEETGRQISEEIYGINFADEALAQALNLPLVRWGGNATSRYNWQADTSNRASDWYFENIANEVEDEGALPTGSAVDRFVAQNERAGSESVLTLPLLGWVAKDREFRCGFSVAKYGPQEETDPWQPDCGNGIAPNGTRLVGNDPTDTSEAITPAFVQGWVRHLQEQFGGAAEGGVRYYALGNEPMLWHETHRDVRPEPAGYEEVWERGRAYAEALKAVDSGAQVLGPVVWGWTAYTYSGVDAVSGNWDEPPDYNAHDGIPFVAWYLQQMAAYEAEHGTRLLDYLDLHYYPQARGVALAPAGDAATRELRLRSTRSLWDPTYVDESWIEEPVMLIPRMRQWVAENYPGTKLALTEYNFGALDALNGALTQADVLGIFGREGLDMAALWRAPALAEPGAFAFRLYRNYDGNNGTFGDLSVAASSAEGEALAIYAARRTADGALTMVIVNKSGLPLQSALTVTGVPASALVAAYRYSPRNLSEIEPLPEMQLAVNRLSLVFPAASLTLLVVE